MAQRGKNLRAVMDWSLKQQDDGERPAQPVVMDPERKQFLSRALESVISAPGETDLLRQSLEKLKAFECSVPCADQATQVRQLTDSEVEELEKTFEQILYLVEDLDHAKDLVPLEGVDVIVKYLSHPDSGLVQLACELVATATQNLPPCQEAFLPSLSRLLAIVSDSDTAQGTRIKALYAVSCLTREYEAGLSELLKEDGLSVLLQCLRSDVSKLVIKSLFLLMSLYSHIATCSADTTASLQAKSQPLIHELVKLLSSCEDREILGHTVSTLVTVIQNYSHAVEQCRNPQLQLRKELIMKKSVLTGPEHEEERESIDGILKMCFQD